MVGDARHWRDQPFYVIPQQLQWQFLESRCEDKFVIQLGALHIKDGCPLIIPNLMVALRSALNDHHIKITRYAHRLSQLSLFLN